MAEVVSLHKEEGSRTVEETLYRAAKDSDKLEVVMVLGITENGGIYCVTSDYSSDEVARFLQHMTWLSNVTYEDYITSPEDIEEVDNEPPAG